MQSVMMIITIIMKISIHQSVNNNEDQYKATKYDNNEVSRGEFDDLFMIIYEFVIVSFHHRGRMMMMMIIRVFLRAW